MKSKGKYAWTSWLLVVGYMALLFYLSSKTGSEISSPVPDYVAHAIAYAGLGFLVHIALVTSGVSLYRAVIISVVVSLLYGVSDEVHQSFVPGRQPSITDLFSDSVGATVAQFVAYLGHKTGVFRRINVGD